ncbi:response regulator [Sphingomonas sp. RB3P16]
MKPLRILVIDDDAAITVALALVLRARSHDVFTARDAATGLASFAAHRPDVLITDIILSGDLAIEMIEQIRRASSEVLIIAMSGGFDLGGASLLHRATAAGADVCLNKPFEMTELFEALEQRHAKATGPPDGLVRH